MSLSEKARSLRGNEKLLFTDFLLYYFCDAMMIISTSLDSVCTDTKI